ncbi:hypothetical protein ACFQZT_01870 [Paenibacillus sp. GCM10027628]|uniref:hypothetical protein n=1 Tax=Paenibacillus sp. GCM10027628 TaxID=3273413 RepID=UPI00364544E7
MATFYEALRHKNRMAPILLKRAEVMAVGVGYADPAKPAEGAGIIIYTHKQIVPSSLNSLKLTLAKAGTSIPVRFISSGMFKTNATAPKPRTIRPKQIYKNRIRPVPGGVSVGKPDPAATGTGGLVVIKNNQLYILSNNHVLIKNNSTAFSETLQPGPADGGVSGRDRIGRAFQFVRLRPGQVNFQDSAIALPTSNSILNPRYLFSAFRLITVPGHLLSYPVGMQVFKTGRTTGFVRGTVESNNVDVNVSYGGSIGTLLFRNQSIIVGNNGAAVSLPGDSGSVWLRSSDRFAAALNFAAPSDGLRSISNPLGIVMSTYGIRTAIPAAGRTFKAGAIKGAAPRGNSAYVQPLTEQQRKRTRAVLVNAK